MAAPSAKNRRLQFRQHYYDGLPNNFLLSMHVLMNQNVTDTSHFSLSNVGVLLADRFA
jgi:hypothetical protein